MKYEIKTDEDIEDLMTEIDAMEDTIDRLKKMLKKVKEVEEGNDED